MTVQGYKSKGDPYSAKNYVVGPFVTPEGKLIPLGVRQRKGALKALGEIRDAFGPRGQYWARGVYGVGPIDSAGREIIGVFDNMCLSGAASLVDGSYEGIARAAITLAILGKLQEDIGGSGDYYITHFNDRPGTAWKDVRKVLAKAKKIVSAA